MFQKTQQYCNDEITYMHFDNHLLLYLYSIPLLAKVRAPLLGLYLNTRYFFYSFIVYSL